MIFLRILAVLCYIVSVRAKLTEAEKKSAIEAFWEIVRISLEPETRVEFNDKAADTLAAKLEDSPYTEECSKTAFVDTKDYVSDQTVTMYFKAWMAPVVDQIIAERDFITNEILAVYRVVGMSAGTQEANDIKNRKSRLFIVFKTVSTVPVSATLKSYVVTQLGSAYSIDKVNRKADALALFCATQLANNKTEKLGYALWRGAKIISTTITNTKEIEIFRLNETTLKNLKTTLASLKKDEEICTPFGISVGCVCSKDSDPSLSPTCYIEVIVTYRFTALSDANNKQVIDSLNAPELKVLDVFAREVAEARSKSRYADVTEDATKFEVEEAVGVFTFIFASIEVGKGFTEMLKKLPLNVIAEKLKEANERGTVENVVGSGSAVARIGNTRKLVVAVVFKRKFGCWSWTPSIYNSNAEATVDLNRWMKSGWIMHGYAGTQRRQFVSVEKFDDYVQKASGVILSMGIEISGCGVNITVIISSEGSPYEYVGKDIAVCDKE